MISQGHVLRIHSPLQIMEFPETGMIDLSRHIPSERRVDYGYDLE